MQWIILLLALNLETLADKPTLTWQTDMDQAMTIAQKEQRVLLVNFTGSDWCYWCKRLKAEVFDQPEFIAYANEQLVLVKLDFPKNNRPPNYNENVRLAQQYQVQGFPTILLMNPKGDVLLRTGYKHGGATSYVKHLQKGADLYSVN